MKSMQLSLCAVELEMHVFYLILLVELCCSLEKPLNIYNITTGLSSRISAEVISVLKFK